MTKWGWPLRRVDARVDFKLICVVAVAIVAVALPAAARLRVLLLAGTFTAFVAAVAAAIAPDGIRHDLDGFDRRGRVRPGPSRPIGALF